MKPILLALLFGAVPLVFAADHTTVVAAPTAAGLNASTEANSIAAARQVMDDFMRTFNARDEDAWADTLLFPHVRFASNGVVVNEDKAEFLAAMDFDQFAQRFDWDHSRWDDVQVVHAASDKVHFSVVFSRFNTAGKRNATFNSLYILQKIDGKWGIRARSSFAP